MLEGRTNVNDRSLRGKLSEGLRAQIQKRMQELLHSVFTRYWTTPIVDEVSWDCEGDWIPQ